jgi:hypothetical protein
MKALGGRPEAGASARTLGVRPESDIPVDASQLVRPGSGGMSVTPDDVMDLPPFRRPPSLGGTGKDPAWAFPEEALGPDLVYRPDPEMNSHGFVEPARVMLFEDFQAALAATADQWSPAEHA